MNVKAPVGADKQGKGGSWKFYVRSVWWLWNKRTRWFERGPHLGKFMLDHSSPQPIPEQWSVQSFLDLIIVIIVETPLKRIFVENQLRSIICSSTAENSALNLSRIYAKNYHFCVFSLNSGQKCCCFSQNNWSQFVFGQKKLTVRSKYMRKVSDILNLLPKNLQFMRFSRVKS